MNNGMAYRASVCWWLLAQVKLTWASPWQQLLRLPAGRYPTNLYFAADLTFSLSLTLLFPPLTYITRARTHVYIRILFFSLPSSFRLSHLSRSISLSLAYLLSRASPSSLLFPLPSCDFYPCFTILFVPQLPRKRETDFGNRRGETILNNNDDNFIWSIRL